MKNVKRILGLLLVLVLLISSVGIGLNAITLKTEFPKASVANFDAGAYRRPAPNITLDVTDVTRVGNNVFSGNGQMGSGTTIRKASISGVPEVTGSTHALGGETAYWPTITFTSSAAVNITGISFTGVTGITTSLTGNLSNTTSASWEITGGTATAGTTIKATITYTYQWNNQYTGVDVTDTYTINGYSYVENIIFPATEWAFHSRYKDSNKTTGADVVYIQRLLGKGVYGETIGLNSSSGEYRSGYFDIPKNDFVYDSDTTMPRRVGLRAEPTRQNASSGNGSYANGTGVYPGDSHRVKTSVYLDISTQTLEKSNFRSFNYLHSSIRSSGWQHYDAVRVIDGNSAYADPGYQGDGLFGSISNSTDAFAALNPSGGTSSTTNLSAVGTEVATTFFGDGGGTNVGSSEYTLITKWNAKGSGAVYLGVYKGITIEINRFDKATLRSFLNSAIGTSISNTVTGSQNVTTVVTANGADPENAGTATTYKGQNPQSWYYSSGWSDYGTAYDTAWTQIVKPNTNQTAIDSAAGGASSGLYNAYFNGLTLARADYDSLDDLVAQVDAHNTGKLINWPQTAYYTTASATALTEAYDAAVASKTAETTGYNILYQQYVDYLAKELQDAIDGLTYVPYITFDANGGTGGTGPTSMQPGASLAAPVVAKEGFVLAGWVPAFTGTVPAVDTTFVAQWVKTTVTVTKTEGGMVVNIQGWVADSKYQIWSYRQIQSDDVLSGNANVKVNQWILSQAYTPGSGGVLQPNGSINFTVPNFTSPTENYLMAVRIADAGNNFVAELRDAYTPEDVQEVVITKILVDGAVTTGYELREIKDGAQALIKVIGNNVPDTFYSAKLLSGPTATDLTVSNTNEVLWDISALEPGIYVIELTATNGDTTATQEVTFELFSLATNITYSSIDEMGLTPVAGGVNITPTYANGTFSFRVREPGRGAQFRSVEYTNAGTVTHPITAPGVYHVYGYVTRAGLIGTEGSYDDGLIRTLVIPRTGYGAATMTFTANHALPNVAKGTAITFTAGATGLPGTVQYSFWRYDATGYVLVKDWSTSPTLNWTPARVGEYQLEARAKGAGAGSFEVKKNLDVNITGNGEAKANITSITLNTGDLTTAQAKKPIMLKANATATNGDDLLYKFYVYDDDMKNQQLKGYSIDQNCVWTPREAGQTYTISVLVKNQLSFGKYDAIESFEVTIPND